MILSISEMSRKVDSAVFPNAQGGPLEHIVAAKAVTFGEAMTPEFVAYQKAVKANARALADELRDGGLRLVSGGTDNHMVLVDLTPSGITGRQAEEALGTVRIVVNRNAVPFDPLPPRTASGMRLGTPAVTSRGFGTQATAALGRLIIKTLSNIGDAAVEAQVRDEVSSLTSQHPVPGIDA
jgi:glycine hydroxymethyltransferase